MKRNLDLLRAIFKIFWRSFFGYALRLAHDDESFFMRIPLTGNPNFEPRYFAASNAIHK